MRLGRENRVRQVAGSPATAAPLFGAGNTININDKEFIMNMTKRIATALFTASVAFTVVGCASTSKHESTGEYVDDAAITTKVKAAIFNEPTLKSTEINVETYKGDVQLSGFVAQPQDATKAAEVARGVKGVNSVKNDIRVK
jgi:osmotically-inducible protein OsmY